MIRIEDVLEAARVIIILLIFLTSVWLYIVVASMLYLGLLNLGGYALSDMPAWMHIIYAVWAWLMFIFAIQLLYPRECS